MKQIVTKRGGLMLLSMALALTTAQPVDAAVVEQIGDRYIIHVPEMNLNGEESLLDVLMMCPDVITLDGKTTIGDDVFAALYGKWNLRIDNIDYGANYEAFLKNIKAREIDKIKVCQHPAVMKGCGGLKNVIDVYLRKNDNGTSGRVALEGDTYGGGKVFASVLHQADKLRVLGIAEGHYMRSKDDEGLTNRGSHQGAKLNVVYDVTPKDQLEFDVSQTYYRNHYTDADATYARHMYGKMVYNRKLSEIGAYALVAMASGYDNNNGDGYHNRVATPYGFIEFSFPIISHNLWLTAGVESGFTIDSNRLAGYTNRSRYEDGYAQIDWNIGKWGFMIGDRYRVIYFRQNELLQPESYEHSVTNHAYTLSAYHRFGEGHTLQGTFARRYYDADFDDFIAMGGEAGSALATNVADGKVYTSDYRERLAYISELKHTYSTSNFVLSSMVKNIHQGLSAGGHDNTLGVGTTAFWHTGLLRLTAGFNYFWEKTSYADGDIQYNNYAMFKLAPQVSLTNGWRFTSLMLYNTRRHEESPVYARANFYADVAVSKSMGKHWLLEAQFHDMAGQHTGNRAATLGVTYYWGK